MDYLVIGAGPAGVVAAEQLRKQDPSGNVVLIGDEPEPPYSRMAIPYYLVKRIDEAGTYLRKDADHYDRPGIEVVQDRVSGVDSANHSVTLQSGGTRSYDRMISATGASPITPPIPGVDLPGVYMIRFTYSASKGFGCLERASAKVEPCSTSDCTSWITFLKVGFSC